MFRYRILHLLFCFKWLSENNIGNTKGRLKTMCPINIFTFNFRKFEVRNYIMVGKKQKKKRAKLDQPVQFGNDYFGV